MREIMPELVWTCPKNGTKFTSIRDRCIESRCEFFFRIKSDVNLGDVCIACTYPPKPFEQSILVPSKQSENSVNTESFGETRT